MPLAGLTATAFLFALALAPTVAAHTPQTAGQYQLLIGWLREPAYVGQPNAVQVTVNDHHAAPVTDLTGDEISVVVSTAGQSSQSLTFVPAFDAVEATGPLGEYDAAIVPTAPGDYTFHVTGSIHGTAIDITLSSGEETFDTVKGSSDLEFPAKLPNLTEVATRLDRIDGRVTALQSADPGAGALTAAQAATDTARNASAAADRALLIGAILGGAGAVLAVIAIALAMRSGRRGAGPA
jgi:hypothetical protein